MATVTGPALKDIETTRKERDLMRKLFGSAKKQLEEALESSVKSKAEIMGRLAQLRNKMERLQQLDEQILPYTLKNEEDSKIEDELIDSERYKDEFAMLQSHCDFIFIENLPVKASDTSICNDNVRRTMKLPKLELKNFNGDVRNWIGFWGQFKKIHEDDTIDKVDKFQYLIQAMEKGSSAYALVNSFPPSEDNYEKAVKQLKSRFARDEFLIDVYVRELLTLVLQQAANPNKKLSMPLSTLYDKLETQLRALETLGVTTDKYAAMLFPLAESALPEDVLRVWERHRNSVIDRRDYKLSDTSTNYLQMLLDFLRNEVEGEERINLAKRGFAAQAQHSRGDQLPSERQRVHGYRQNTNSVEGTTAYTTSALYSVGKGSGKQNFSCLFCEGKSHTSQDCCKARKMSIDERKEILVKRNACFACLRPNHTIKRCKIFVQCIVCGKRHFPIMCSDLSKEKVIPVNNGAIVEGNKGQVENALYTNNKDGTLLQTLALNVVANGKTKQIRCLLDGGSQRSYILAQCARNAKCDKVGQECIIQGVFGGTNSDPKVHNVYEVTIENMCKTFKCTLSALEQNKICNFIPKLSDENIIKELQEKNITLSDIKVQEREISLLLGADIYGKLLTGRLEHLNGGLVALETYFGWVVTGLSSSVNPQKHVLSYFSDVCISNLWRLDILGIKDCYAEKSKEVEQIETVEFFCKSIRKNDEGRYEVKLPWRRGFPKLLDNKHIAENRLLSNTKKLQNIEKFIDYSKVFKEWETLGIIEKVDEKHSSSNIHYVPHHAVIKESSHTTKIRPVFNCSNKDKNGNCLNECLEKGPNLIELIPSLLLKFRVGLIGIISDIEKAFLQISIAQEDRDVLRFLWWKDEPFKDISVYRHARVVFGMSSSPFLLAATLKHHLENVSGFGEETAKKLNESFYVDNCVTSVNNELELHKFVSECKVIMASASFNLRGWVYNASKVDQDEEEVVSNNDTVSVLGLIWNHRNDTLLCEIDDVASQETIKYTKRGLLSMAQRIFDPIGFSCPVTLASRLLLQETWRRKIGWDSTLPEEIIKKFMLWLKSLSFLKLCQIPRGLTKRTPLEECEKTSIHVFSDASKFAYAACVFLRVEEKGETSLKLLQAKCRIAPMKPISIPRLELLGALIACRLCKGITAINTFKDIPVYYWTDSKVVLTWIKTKSVWNTFVGNRIAEIRSLSSVQSWHYIPGKQNPADLPSRGCNGKTLLETKWWEGPEWLKEEEEIWLNRNEDEFREEEAFLEARKTSVSLLTHQKTINREDICTERLNAYYSKYSKIVRMTAWILRFIQLRKDTQFRGRILMSEELLKAEMFIIRLIQLEEMSNLEKVNLEVFEDDEGILRVKTRLTNCEEIHDFKYPIILPYHPIVKKYIQEEHEKLLHAGTQAMLTNLREKYWIIKGRKMVKSVISTCVKCKRYKVKHVETKPSPLPYNRTKIGNVFEVTGIDLAGPLILRSKGQENKEKVWIVLFTCAIYRACHFELCRSLSTHDFLMAFKRFISRRGRVSIVYSDNGTNFKGAYNLLQKVDWNEISSFSATKQIKWYFNPPTAAWWGGWWERIVRMIKELLRRNLGRYILEYDEMETILCECEAIINSRPLTYYEESSNLIALTPACFMQGMHGNENPDLEEIDRQGIIKRARFLQRIKDSLRERFRNEYLSNLVNRKKETGRKVSEINVGDVVLVGTDNIKRAGWPMGLVEEIYQGRDGIVRVAKIRIGNGTIIRPIQRIYPLEISEKTEAIAITEVKNKIAMRECSDRNGSMKNENEIESEKLEESEERKHDESQDYEEAGRSDGREETEEKRTRYGRVSRAPRRFEY